MPPITKGSIINISIGVIISCAGLLVLIIIEWQENVSAIDRNARDIAYLKESLVQIERTLGGVALMSSEIKTAVKVIEARMPPR